MRGVLFLTDGAVKLKSKEFALRIIKLYKYLCNDQKEFVMSKQIIKCGTSIGANVCEADHSMSKREFIAKMNISLKEAAESEYWLELLYESEYITRGMYRSLLSDCGEIKGLLICIIRTANKNISNSNSNCNCNKL